MACDRRILVVDDDIDVRENIALALKFEGYQVLEAANGLEAIQILLSHDPSKICCIVLDIMMPVMDGFSFMKTIMRDHPKDLAQIPVVVASAKRSPIDPKQIPDEIRRIRKPIDLDELYAVLEGYCGKAV